MIFNQTQAADITTKTAAELARRTSDANKARSSLEALDPDDVATWEKADANHRRLLQAQRHAEEQHQAALAELEAEQQKANRAELKLLRKTLTSGALDQEVLALLPRLQAVFDEARTIGADLAMVVDARGQRFRRALELCTLLQESNAGLTNAGDVFTQVVKLRGALQRPPMSRLDGGTPVPAAHLLLLEV